MPFYKFADMDQVTVAQYSTASGGTVYGEKIEVGMYSYPPDTGAQPHQHPEEQILTIISGRGRFTIDGEVYEVGPGQVVHIPPNTVHSFHTLTALTTVNLKNRIRTG